jgi:predicted RNA-binding protein with PUA-like domain
MAKAQQYWLVKQEPESYSWNDFVKDKVCEWDGVRNYQARNDLRAMTKGDPVLFCHSVSEKQVVGIAKVAREHYPDPTAKEGDWSCVDLKPVKTVKQPVTLDDIKAQKSLQKMVLLRNSRLSVQPVTTKKFDQLVKMSGTKLSAKL